MIVDGGGSMLENKPTNRRLEIGNKDHILEVIHYELQHGYDRVTGEEFEPYYKFEFSATITGEIEYEENEELEEVKNEVEHSIKSNLDYYSNEFIDAEVDSIIIDDDPDEKYSTEVEVNFVGEYFVPGSNTVDEEDAIYIVKDSIRELINEKIGDFIEIDNIVISSTRVL